jgi:DNA polymerase-1
MTSQWLPRYAGYEDDLEVIKAKQAALLEAERQATGIKIELKGAAKKLHEDDGYATIALKPLNEYGAVDGDVTRRMAVIQQKRMAEEEIRVANARNSLRRFQNAAYQKASQPGTTIKNPLLNLMRNQLIPATLVLAEMESWGFAVDREYTQQLAFDMDDAIVESKARLLLMIPAGAFPDGFNPDSPPQLRTLFFATGYLHPETQEPVTYEGVIPEDDLVYTEAGQLSTSAAVLRMLKNRYKCAFAKELLTYRGITKARNTFIANILALSEEDGRMHTTFHIPGTATGRLSSSDENMQNIPKKIGRYNLKKIFIPSRPELVIVNADVKAVEVRLYAAYSQDPNLVSALNDGMDPHSFFASTVYDPKSVLQGVPRGQQKLVLETIGIDENHAWSYEDFQKREALIGTEEMPGSDPKYGKRLGALRKNIKRVVFGILYGASKYKIASIVGIPDEQAQAIIDVLFRMFPTIPEYISHTELQVEQLQMVETFLGRRRRFNLRGMTPWMRSKAKRQAVNFKIQGTASDIVIDTLCALYPEIKRLGGQMLITVHDSLVFELPPENLHHIPGLIQRYGVERVARKCPWLPVPFSWDIEVGPSYGELQSLENYLSQSKTPQLVTPEDLLEEHEIRQEFANNPELAV